MSFGTTNNTPQAPAQLLNVDANTANSNQEAVPLPYFAGRARLGLKWFSPAYNQRADPVTQKAGKGSSSTIAGYNYYGDLIGALCHGPLDAVLAVIVDSGLAWSGTLTRASGETSANLSIPGYGTLKIMWGTEDAQPAVSFATPRAGSSADAHPAYKGIARVELKQWFFGRDRTSVPNIELIVQRTPRFFSALDCTAAGVVPQGVLYELLSSPRFGLDVSDALFDSASWVAAATAAAADGIRMAPVIADLSSMHEVTAKLLEYYDGWVRQENGALKTGYFTRGVLDTSGLPVLDDSDLLEEPQIADVAIEDSMNFILTTYTDPARYYKQVPARYTDEVNFLLTGERRPLSIDRSWILGEANATAYAAQYGRMQALPKRAGTIKVRRERAMTLRPGSRVVINSATAGISAVYRILSRSLPRHGRQDVTLELENERSIWPSIYVPVPTARPVDFYVVPVAIAVERVVTLPSGLKTSARTQIAVLAQRPDPILVGFRVWLSSAGTSYDLIGPENRFALHGSLTANYTAATSLTDVTTGFVVYLDGVDAGALVGQTDTQRDEKRLLCWIGGEIMSVGAITALGGNLYRVYPLRACYGTAQSAHSIGDDVWFLLREQVAAIDNAAIYPGASVFLKIPTHTSIADLALSDTSAIALTISGTGMVATPISFTASTYARLANGNAIEVHVQASWDFPADQDAVAFEVSIKRQSDLDSASIFRTTTEKSADWVVAPATALEVKVRAVTSYGERGPWTTPIDLTSATDSAFGVQTLALKGGGSTFNTPDAEFSWALQNLGIGSGGQHPLLRDYRVRIYRFNAGTSTYSLLREEYVTDPRYNYAQARNIIDNGIYGAARQIRIAVAARSTDGAISADVTLDVSNPMPTQPAAAAFGVTFSDDLVTLTMPAITDPDFAGWILTSSGVNLISLPYGTNIFYPSPNALGTGSQFQFTQPIGTSWYYYVAALDSLDPTGANALTWTTLHLTNGTVTVPLPSIDPASRSFTDSGGAVAGTDFIRVNVSVPSGYTLRYTNDGGPVTSNSDEWPKVSGVYSYGDFPNTVVLRFRLFATDGRASSEVFRQYVRTSASTAAPPATPSISKATAWGEAGNATITCATSGATIRYRLNAGSWVTYSSPVALSEDDLLEAQAQKTGQPDSSIARYLNTAPRRGHGGLPP